MKNQAITKVYLIMTILTLALLTGCANNCCREDSNHRQGPPPSWQGDKGGHRGPPPPQEMAKSGGPAKTPPAEAFAACTDKKSGDNVEFTTPWGETIEATCQEYEDHLVAIPKKMEKKKPND